MVYAIKYFSEIVLKYGQKTFSKATDYKVSYSSNTKVGTAHVKVTGIGNFNGTRTLTFKIVPSKQTIKKLSSGKKKLTVTYRYSPSTGYQVSYSTNSKYKNAKTLTVTSAATTTKTISKLKSGKKYYVKVRTYKTIRGEKYYSPYSSSRTVTVK